MEIEQIISQVSIKLESFSKEVQSNLEELIKYFNNAENLTPKEREATQISFWRSIDDKSCSAFVEKLLDDDEYDDQIESKYQRFPIFENWQDCISWKEIFELTEEDENLSNKLEVELEVLYLQWFIKNWYIANGHLSSNVQYYIIENNSVRNFDLKRFNFTDMYKGHKGIDRNNPFYEFKLSESEIRNRVLMDMVDHIYHKPIVRKLSNKESTIEFWYSQCELIIRELKKGELPKIILAKKMKSTENKYKIKSEYLILITYEIDKLIQKGYREIE